MPDSDRFSDIADKLDEDASESVAASDVEDSRDSHEAHESGESRDSHSSDDSGNSSTSADEDTEDDSAAFPADAASKTTVYGTEQTIEDYQSLLERAEATAVAEHELTDVASREVHNAALLVAIESEEAVAQRIVEEREA